jgi:DNA-binding transcriptional regulator YiaG
MNLAGVLKDAMRRLARKEIRAETGKTKQAVAQYRRDIARLKREIHSQRREIAVLKAQDQKRLGQRVEIEEPSDKTRFSARSVRAQRKRLKISAEDYAKLVGVSKLTIYKWELGRARPRKAQLAALVSVRGIGKREAAAKLEALAAKEKRAVKKARKPARRRPG